MGALAELLKLGLKTAMKETDSSVSYALKNLGNQPLKLKKFAKKQAEKLGEDADQILREGEEGLPTLLYHRTDSPNYPTTKKTKETVFDEVPEFSLPSHKVVIDDFLSTSTNPEGFYNRFTTNKDDPSRVLIGMGKVKKIFDHTDEKQVDELVESFSKKLDKDNLVDLKRQIKGGNWMYLEQPSIKKKLKELGYDSFTTWEDDLHVMLLDPDKQFIPLFDPLKKNPIGYKKGGQLSSTLKQLSYR